LKRTLDIGGRWSAALRGQVALPGERYEIVMVTIDGEPIRSESEMTMVPDAAIIDTVSADIGLHRDLSVGERRSL